jgi:hypothetical protein
MAKHVSKEDKREVEAQHRLAHKQAMREARVVQRAQDAQGGDWHLKLIPQTVRLQDWKLAMKARVARQRKPQNVG